MVHFELNTMMRSKLVQCLVKMGTVSKIIWRLILDTGVWLQLRQSNSTSVLPSAESDLVWFDDLVSPELFKSPALE